MEVTVFLFAALSIHLVCLDPDLPSALEKCDSSNHRAGSSLGREDLQALLQSQQTHEESESGSVLCGL